MLPKENFGRAQCRDKTLSRNGRKKTEKMTRICMACAVQTKFYRHLKPVKWQGVRQYHCHQCGHIGPAGQCCRRVYKPYDHMPVVCLHHLVCYSPHQQPEAAEPLAPLESLDEGIMKKIIQFLEYRDAINLERVNRHMAYIVEPTQMVPIHERYLLTNERFTGRLPIPWRCPLGITDFLTRVKLPCFVCFRIRDSKHFSKRQIVMAQNNPRGYYRMRCSSCLVKLYVECDQTLLAQYNSYRMCPGCWCLAAVAKKCENCAEWAVTGKPLHDPPYPIPKMPLPKMTDTEIFESMIGSPPDPRREYHFLTPETFPLRKKPVLRSEDDFDEDEFIRKIVEMQKK